MITIEITEEFQKRYEEDSGLNCLYAQIMLRAQWELQWAFFLYDDKIWEKHI